jgi:glycosyltransferase involved in cell wall biosynthesis
VIVTVPYPSTPNFGGGVAAVYEYADALARRGHEVHFAHLQVLPDAITSVEEIGWHQFHPSVVHHLVADFEDPSLPQGDIGLRSDVPAHLGLPVEILQGYKLLATSMERPAFRAACPKICVARWLREVGEAWGADPIQFWPIPPGIDTSVFTCHDWSDPRPIDVTMLYSSHPVKGTADGLAALELLRRARPDLRVALFSWQEPPTQPPAWADLHVGLAGPALAEHLFGRTKVFVQASWREGFGLTPVEAMACGAALVTTDNGGSRDYADHGRTAMVVPPRDVEALADAIASLLEDEDGRAEIARIGSAHAATFTWDAAGEHLERRLEDYLRDPERYQRPAIDAPMFLEDEW